MKPVKDLDQQAPRVTLQAIEANIASEHYFTAAEGAQVGYSPQKIDAPLHPSLGRLTICVLVLRNGYTVIGESACVSAKNFDEAVGRQIARANAVQKIWPLMGYALQQQLHDAK